MCSSDLFLCVLAILFPPLPGVPKTVWVKRGICSADSIINILLCCLGFIPGLIHAWYIIAKFPDPEYDYDPVPQDAEGGRVRYIVIDRHHCQHPNNKSQGSSRPAPNNNVNYGTANASSAQQQQQQKPAHAPQQQGLADAAEGSSSNNQGVPPSYAEVVAGDNKIQSHD
ncbi:unnamed protein product [Clonostachys byssicola]|uniref:Plasma membrane proteolipid 3 n=1 Tax=Clonostachys byssicola TaxID=160290 RepID=A0A9N9Y1Q8_9HYPO|nr:unnamed protein product [Clonostachys byssicola]